LGPFFQINFNLRPIFILFGDFRAGLNLICLCRLEKFAFHHPGDINAEQVACMQDARGPAQATKKYHDAACLCFLNFLHSFVRQPIGLIPYFLTCFKWASASPWPQKKIVFGCAVALCTMDFDKCRGELATSPTLDRPFLPIQTIESAQINSFELPRL
jgi:hypothetical protein